MTESVVLVGLRLSPTRKHLPCPWIRNWPVESASSSHTDSGKADSVALARDTGNL